MGSSAAVAPPPASLGELIQAGKESYYIVSQFNLFEYGARRRPCLRGSPTASSAAFWGLTLGARGTGSRKPLMLPPAGELRGLGSRVEKTPGLNLMVSHPCDNKQERRKDGAPAVHSRTDGGTGLLRPHGEDVAQAVGEVEAAARRETRMWALRSRRCGDDCGFPWLSGRLSRGRRAPPGLAWTSWGSTLAEAAVDAGVPPR